MKIEVNTRKIEPIERVAMALNLKGDEENIALKIQDKINLKDKLIRKLKFENVLLKEKLNKSQNKKEEIIHKDKDYDILDARLKLSIIQPTRPYNLDDICNIFNINKQTIRQYIKDNKIYAKKVGNQYTVLGTSILDFLKKRDD